MLTNLVNMIETEGQADDEHTAEFQSWCNQEIKTNTHIVETEQRRIEDTNAILSDLRAQKTKLVDVVGSLNTQITDETSQLNQATQRRNEEHSSFSAEMPNFDNAISACDKAVEMLRAHYGDGKAKEAKKPEWMSLLSTYISTAHTLAGKLNVKAKSNLRADPYQESSGEGLNIVDQVAELRASFAEDQQTSREEEARMQGVYDNLAAKKTELINSLTTERNTQQTQLNVVNQGIAESETVLSMAEELLADRQAYLATIQQQLSTQTQAYETRKADRQAENQAVGEAVKVLQAKSFVQLGATVTTVSAEQLAKLKEISAHQANYNARFADAAERVARDVAQRGSSRLRRSSSQGCPNCRKAAALLKSQAKLFHSSVLAMAAATSMSNAALDDVVRSLDDMIRQLGRDQKTEKEHKDWCQSEISLTTGRKQTHTYAVASIEQNIADLGEVISMKQTSLGENAQDIQAAQTAFDQLTAIRGQQKEEFEDDVQDHQDALTALNEAINILAEMYASRSTEALSSRQSGSPGIPSLVQISVHDEQPSDGSRTVKMMTGVREEFEAAIVALKKNEAKALVDYNAARDEHTQTDSDLKHDKDTMTVELQTAQQSLAMNKRDHETHTGEIRAAENYLSQLNRSCGPLLDNYDNRKKLREEEKKAIEEAQKVLKEVQ